MNSSVLHSSVKATPFDRLRATLAAPRSSLHGANRRTDPRRWTLRAILWLALCLPTAIGHANATEATSDTPPFLVIEGAWLTEAPATATDPPDAIELLYQNAVRAGTATDFVLEHAAIASRTGSGNTTPRSFTVWNRFAPSAIAVVPHPDGRSVTLTLRTDEGLLLDFRIESDDGPVASGFYADDETWIRLNAFELSPEGQIVLDLEYETPIDGALHSGRLRVNAPQDDADSVFLPTSEAELRDARPGGIAPYWIQFGDGVAAAPLYFGEQFSEAPVLSHEQALRRVAPDRRKLESDLPDRSPRESTPEPSPNRSAPPEPTPPSSVRPSPQSTVPDTSFEALQPTARPRSPSTGGIPFGAGIASPQQEKENQSPSPHTAERSRFSHPPVHPPNASFLRVTEPWYQGPEHNPPDRSDSAGARSTPPTPDEERSETADRLARSQATSMALRSPQTVEADRRADSTIRRASFDPPTAGHARPAFTTGSPESPAPSGFTTRTRTPPTTPTPTSTPTAPSNPKPLGESFEKTFSQSLDLAVDRLRNLVRRGLEWWQGSST